MKAYTLEFGIPDGERFRFIVVPCVADGGLFSVVVFVERGEVDQLPVVAFYASGYEPPESSMQAAADYVASQTASAAGHLH